MQEQPQEMEIKDAEGLRKMRAAGRLARRVLDYAGNLARIGNNIPNPIDFYCFFHLII
jgi:methionine aminopeptidase